VVRVRRRSWVLALLLAVAVLAALGLAVSGATRSTTDPAPQVLDKVVLLGDSYSSGNGAGQYVDACFRTPLSAGRRYAAQVGASVVDVSCSGARTADLTTARGEGRPAQVEAVDTSADVVVLTMGGNDVGFGNLVLQCFLLRSGTADRGCAAAVQRARDLLPTVRTDLTRGLTAVREHMRPDAVLVLRSYPLLAPDRPFVQQGGYDANRAVRALGRAGTAMQEQVVEAVRSSGPGRDRTYLDTSAETVFAGHEPGLPTGAGASWFVGFGTRGARQGEVYHPSPDGWQAWGDALTRFMAGREQPPARQS
jgi:lysophospholipase L1-like esterase